MHRIITAVMIVLFIASTAGAVERTVGISDREIIESLAELKEGQKALNQKIGDGSKATNQRIDDLRSEVQAIRDLIYVIIGGIFVLIGFVIWDRRSALAPAIKKAKELEEREELLEKAMKEYAKIEPRFADILKAFKI
ncbi:MAG: hypothetical protein HY805_03335 [Nitrospirae bacterium]|nr:hypothetical protein [Nitrospirota bacterium]